MEEAAEVSGTRVRRTPEAGADFTTSSRLVSMAARFHHLPSGCSRLLTVNGASFIGADWNPARWRREAFPHKLLCFLSRLIQTGGFNLKLNPKF